MQNHYHRATELNENTEKTFYSVYSFFEAQYSLWFSSFAKVLRADAY